MSYQVLARKYRPGKLNEVVGQEQAVRALTNALDLDRLHHAYMFAGTRGVGKTTIARILAKSFNCEKGVSSVPCGECDSCVEIVTDQFVDLFEIDAASQSKVENIRLVLENVQYSPSRGRYKVYIIDEVHMLSDSSFNALLKTLEEPPEHVKFVLATTNPKKVPITVRSRCLQFHLKNILPEVIEQQLQKILQEEKIDCDDESLKIIARMSHGSMRDALSITDQAIAHCDSRLVQEGVVDMLGLTRIDKVAEILALLASNDREGLFEFIQQMTERPVDYADLIGRLQTTLHELALVEAARFTPSESIEKLVGKFNKEWLQTAYQILLLARRDLQYAPEPRVGFEMSMIRLLDFEPLMVTTRSFDKPLKQGEKTESLSTVKSEPRDAKTVQSKVPTEFPKKPSGRKPTSYAERRQRAREEMESDESVQHIKKKFDAEIIDIVLQPQDDSGDQK